ncbi:MAG: hypothetical protein IPM45_06535 [Acidimicrobiales bacterium]|nr:hypothetical protein [Acidimicrobiales bacterium]
MGPSTRDLLRRLLLGGIVVGAVLAIVIGVTRGRTGPAVTVTDAAVELQVPRPGELVLRQAQAGVDLAPGYVAVLVIDGVEIPLDQYTIADPTNLETNPLGQFLYQPGPGKEIEEFAPGDHTITAELWPAAEGRERSRRVTWTFSVA